MSNNYKDDKCPNCGCDRFVSEPNAWDVMQFNLQDKDNHFDIIKQEYSDYTEHIFCQECYAEVDEKESKLQHKIILKQEENN